MIFDSVLTNVGKYLVERFSFEGGPLAFDGRESVLPAEVTELVEQALSILERGLGKQARILATMSEGGD